MNCEEARESLLDSLIEPVRAEVQLSMEDHLVGCEACRLFAGVQRSIDARLTATVPAVSLSAVNVTYGWPVL
jgi:predicted anti-sigma-YlaC factor YlaD